MFARLSSPQKVISGNGPQYSSQEYVTFATEYGLMHATSSPRHPQSNGLAVKSVQNAKRIFEKSKSDGRDRYLVILEYRTTPFDIGSLLQNYYMVASCAQYCPFLISDQLKPKVIKHREVRIRLGQSHVQQKQYCNNKQARPLPPIEVGDSVRIK